MTITLLKSVWIDVHKDHLWSDIKRLDLAWELTMIFPKNTVYNLRTERLKSVLCRGSKRLSRSYTLIGGSAGTWTGDQHDTQASGSYLYQDDVLRTYQLFAGVRYHCVMIHIYSRLLKSIQRTATRLTEWLESASRLWDLVFTSYPWCSYDSRNTPALYVLPIKCFWRPKTNPEWR